jgi:hypothetical protein
VTISSEQELDGLVPPERYASLRPSGDQPKAWILWLRTTHLCGPPPTEASTMPPFDTNVSGLASCAATDLSCVGRAVRPLCVGRPATSTINPPSRNTAIATPPMCRRLPDKEARR